MKILVSNDWHVTGKGPATRKDDFLGTIERKLDFIEEIAKAEKVDAIGVAGDLFDKTTLPYAAGDHAPMTQIVVRLKRWAAQWPILVIPGNHDMPHNRLDLLKYTPFGVLMAAGILTPAWGKAWRHPDGSWVGGVPYPATEDAIAERSLAWAGEGGPGVVLVHGYASVVGGDYFGEGVICYSSLAQRIPNAVAFVFGHDHRDNGIVVSEQAVFIQVGALLRGTLSQDQITRQPKIVLLETVPEMPLLGRKAGANVTPFLVPIKPAEEVFDLAKKAQVETIESQIDQYVTELAKATAARGASVIDLGDLDITDDVRSRVKKYLERAAS